MALLGLPALMATRVQLLTVTGRDDMPDVNKALTLNVYKREAAESLNSLAGLMHHDTDQLDSQLDPMVAWQNLRLGEFGPQMNLLTEVIQEEQPQEPALEVPVDQNDEVDAPPGIEPIPDEELPSPSEAASEAVAADLVALMSASHTGWHQRPEPFTPGQWVHIHRTELTNSLIEAGTGNLSDETQTDEQWQSTFQSHTLPVSVAENNCDSEPD
ncbi:MAG: hypothetical protein GY835_22310, partial [bacterium]|nr:hypothetical protein [bacterium]